MNFKEHQTEQKLRGGYYTTEDLVDFLSRWVAAVNPDSVLEPSCGDGAFVSRIATHMGDPTVTAIEVEKAEARKAWEKAVNSGLSEVDVQASDFLGWALEALKIGRQFDAIIGNPPFIRYQYLPSLFQDRAQSIFNALNCKFTKHTNAWVPFVMASFALLRPGGKAGNGCAGRDYPYHARTVLENLLRSDCAPCRNCGPRRNLVCRDSAGCGSTSRRKTVQ